jgi:hypothetical protein
VGRRRRGWSCTLCVRAGDGISEIRLCRLHVRRIARRAARLTVRESSI